MTYVERLARIEASTPRTEYISNDEYRKQKSALTRAVNSGDPAKVLATVEKTLEQWRGKAWPDDWNRWRIALEDAAWAQRRIYLDTMSSEDGELFEELQAASLVLFRF